MTHGSIFSGIGGFDLAAQRAGMINSFMCEIDTYCQKVLRKNFPGIPLYDNVYNLTKKTHEKSIDVLSGGFPCQPFSNAGNKKGEKDERYLWPQMRRIYQEFRPGWVVAENVGGLATMGFKPLFSTLESQEFASQEIRFIIQDICKDFEADDYTVHPIIIPAASVNAIHRRDRVWFIAHDNRLRRNRSASENEKHTAKNWVETFIDLERCYIKQSITDTMGGGIDAYANGTRRTELNIAAISEIMGYSPGLFASTRLEWPTEPPVCRADDGIPNRVDRTRALGNAIVPQLAEIIFKLIILINNNLIF